MPNIEKIQAYVTLLKDALTCVAAIVAIVGLGTWKSQLTANAERDLARRVLIAVYKVRDAVNHCRSYRRVHLDSVDIAETRPFHDKQFAKLTEAKASLDVDLLEAEAVWGDNKNYVVSFRNFSDVVIELQSAYWLFYLKKITRRQKTIAYLVLFAADFPEDKDEYADQLKNAVKRIEDFLRPKLTLKQRWWHRFKKQKN